MSNGDEGESGDIDAGRRWRTISARPSLPRKRANAHHHHLGCPRQMRLQRVGPRCTTAGFRARAGRNGEGAARMCWPQPSRRRICRVLRAPSSLFEPLRSNTPSNCTPRTPAPRKFSETHGLRASLSETCGTLASSRLGGDLLEIPSRVIGRALRADQQNTLS